LAFDLVWQVAMAIPTLVIFFMLQKQFVAGLTMGANKG